MVKGRKLRSREKGLASIHSQFSGVQRSIPQLVLLKSTELLLATC